MVFDCNYLKFIKIWLVHFNRFCDIFIKNPYKIKYNLLKCINYIKFIKISLHFAWMFDLPSANLIIASRIPSDLIINFRSILFTLHRTQAAKKI